MMKVFHINCNYITTALHQIMIEHLDNGDVESKVCVPVCDNDIEQAVVKPHDNVKVLNCFKKRDRAVFFYKQRKIFRAVEPEFTRDKYDLIHAYTVFSDGNCAMQLSKKYDVPYAVAVRDTDVNAFFKYMIHLRPRGIEILRKAKAVFFLSDTYREYVLNRYVPEKYREEINNKSYIQPNGIEDFWLDNIGKEKDNNDSGKIKVIFVGRINRRKNPLATVEALKILQKQGTQVEYTVVGKVEDQELFSKIENEPFLKYIQFKPKEEIIDLYRTNDIFVMPSLTETFGLAYVEAMSQGLPVIYSKGQGFDGQFKEGYVGFHVNPNTPQNIVDAIMLIKERYSEISNNCIHAAIKFDWKTICDNYRRIYYGTMLAVVKDNLYAKD